MRNDVCFGGYELGSRMVHFNGHRGFMGMNESSLRTAAQMRRNYYDSMNINAVSDADIRHGNGGGIYKI